MSKKYALIVILITAILELTIFNINSYRMIFSKYEQKDVSINECKLENLTYNEETDTYDMKDKDAYIFIDNVNCKIATIYLDASIVGNIYVEDSLKYSVLYTDETSKNYRELPVKYFVNSINKSKYVTCYLSGKSEKIGIKLCAENEIKLKINSIKINSRIPFKFNIYRVIVIISFFVLLHSIKKSKVFNEGFKDNEKISRKIMFITAFFFIILNTLSAQNTIKNVSDFYSRDYAKAIINGKSYLEKEPSNELLKLDNPYDTTQRIRSRDGWDIALFNGKYYVYFGILPEILFFVPYMLINNRSLPSGVVVLFFSIFAILGLTMLIIKIIEKWFNKVPFKLCFFSEVILLSGALIFNIIGRPEFYEVAVASALCLSVYGILFAFIFFTSENQRYKDLLLASIFLALAVACRPTSLFVSIIVMPLIIMQLIKNIKQGKNITKIILSVSIPYLSVGLLLMFFNYIRFKNPFEFGAKYQLTINDLIHLRYRFMTIPVGLYTAFLKIPHFIQDFPFIKTDGKTISFFGYFYTEDNIGGLFTLVPTTLSVLLIPKIKFKNKDIKYLVYSFSIVGFLISIISITKAGVLQRYIADYAWILIIASLTILLTIFENYKADEAKNVLIKIIGICTIFTFFINLFSGGIVGEKDYMKVFNPKTYYSIRYTMFFWE